LTNINIYLYLKIRLFGGTKDQIKSSGKIVHTKTFSTHYLIL